MPGPWVITVVSFGEPRNELFSQMHASSSSFSFSSSNIPLLSFSFSRSLFLSLSITVPGRESSM